MNAILYASKTKLTPDHQSVRVHFPSAGHKVPIPLPPGVVFIRVEVRQVFSIDAGNLTATLDRAKPRKGETVLNSN